MIGISSLGAYALTSSNAMTINDGGNGLSCKINFVTNPIAANTLTNGKIIITNSRSTTYSSSGYVKHTYLNNGAGVSLGGWSTGSFSVPPRSTKTIGTYSQSVPSSYFGARWNFSNSNLSCIGTLYRK